MRSATGQLKAARTQERGDDADSGVRRRCPGAVSGRTGRRTVSSMFIIFIIVEFVTTEFSESSLEGRINLWVFSSRIFGSGAKKKLKTLENHHSLFFSFLYVFELFFFDPFFIGLIT